ncbi:MAG: FAA hydrolase family protein [Acidobacteria bacterium]|nr:FAA hydrolase family protein [Acidobacteriota bacterium]
MKLIQFKTGTVDGARLGVLRGDVIVDVTAVAPDLRGMIELGAEGLRAASQVNAGAAYEAGAVEFLPAVTPSKIVCVGRNYYEHAKEGGDEPPAMPLLFNKLPTTLNSHQGAVTLHSISEQIDFEAELAVIIGRRASRVSEATSLDHVYGYSCLNDVSARDLQFADGQWMRGKSLDGFAPIGPWVVTKDEIPDPQALGIEGRLNGEVMQKSNTSNMIFKVAYLIHYISQGITLEPGDVIATGTPEGVGVFRKPPILLKDGDVFEVIIDGIGTLRNSFVSQR